MFEYTTIFVTIGSPVKIILLLCPIAFICSKVIIPQTSPSCIHSRSQSTASTSEYRISRHDKSSLISSRLSLSTMRHRIKMLLRLKQMGMDLPVLGISPCSMPFAIFISRRDKRDVSRILCLSGNGSDFHVRTGEW